MIDDGEVLHTQADKHLSGMPRHKSGREMGTALKRPILWNAKPAQHHQGGIAGVYPKGWLEWALRSCELAGIQHRELLHVCSGGLGRDVVGIRVDIRPMMNPDVVADGRALPFADGTFRCVLLDPPYSVEYAEELYGTEYPRPSHLLKEAARVVRPGGVIGMLHFLVPHPPLGCDFVKVEGVTQGCGYRIRAFTVFRRHPAPLPFQ